jgi:hypothetical protein
MNIRQLQPIQDFAHFEQGGLINLGPWYSHSLGNGFNPVGPIKDQVYKRDQSDAELKFANLKFAKGGRVKKQKQKQSQRQTQIVNIHTTAPRRTRRSAPRKQQQIQLPPVFTSVPSGYIHRPEPPTINPIIMNRLDEIEIRMRNGFLNQLPGVLGNQDIDAVKTAAQHRGGDDNQNEANSVSSLVPNPGKGSEEEFDNQIPENLNEFIPSGMAASASAAASSSSSAGAAPSKDVGIPWQGVNVYVSRNKTLMYNSAGVPKYISEYIKGSPKRIADLKTLYSALDKKGIEYNKNFTIGS